MTLFKKPGKQSGNKPPSNTPANMSSTAQTTDEMALTDLPTLTEVIAIADPHLPHELSAEEIQQLLRQLEKHIETLFSQKLALHLEQVQRLAIDQAMIELKAELPELLRNGLKAHLKSR